MTRPGVPCRAVLLVLLVLTVAACGRRGAPVAPELRVPVAVTAVDSLVRAEGIDLTWSLPERRVDGSRLRSRDLEAAIVYRAEDEGAGEPQSALLERGRIRGYTEIARIRLESPAPATLGASTIRFTDRAGLRFDRRYTYVVLTEDTAGRMSPPSPRLPVVFIAAPERPRDLAAAPGDGEVRLAWEAPARLVDGRPVAEPLRYEILRGEGEAPLVPLPGPGTTEPTLVDRAVANEQPYRYAVRAVRVVGPTRAVSAPTAPVAATPTDMTPPSPPRDLVAIRSALGVRLSWRASPEPDVARYNIYRAREGQALTPIGSVPATVSTFIDADPPTGRLRYVVTAEDGSPRRNESGPSDAAAVSAP